jgi:hypothetical protein
VVLGIQNWAINNPAIFGGISRKIFWVVYNMENNSKNLIMQIVAVLIKKYIWDCKVRFTLPDLEVGKEFVKYELDRIISQSGKIKKAYISSEFTFISD